MQSDYEERPARVAGTAEYVWDDQQDACVWPHKLHLKLENRPPLEAALIELGARRAEELLDPLLFGIPG